MKTVAPDSASRLGESFVEYTTSGPHKRATLAILHVARLFTDKH